MQELKRKVLDEESSVLIILNTIDDSNELYDVLSDFFDNETLILLNTHFTPDDRKKKIDLAKNRLKNNLRVIIVSTQLIEAGVDIDFPVVYRDFTTVSSIVQSAGRCNRNGKMTDKGKVLLFCLKKDERRRYEMIFRGKDRTWIDYTQNAFTDDSYEEKALLRVQKAYFDQIQGNSLFGVYGKKLENNFLYDIKDCLYEKIGQFRLIDEDFYGEERRYYVREHESDHSFDCLLSKHDELIEMLRNDADFIHVKAKKKEIEILLKEMSNRIVVVRLKKNQTGPLAVNESYYDLCEIGCDSYSFERGIRLDEENNIL